MGTKIQIDEALAKAATKKIERLEAENAALCKALDEVMRKAKPLQQDTVAEGIRKALRSRPASGGNDVGGSAVSKAMFRRRDSLSDRRTTIEDVLRRANGR